MGLKKWEKQHLEKKEAKGTPLWMVVLGLALLVGGGFFALSGFGSGAVNASGPPIGNVHWHADASFDVCGEERSLPRPATADGHLGTGLIHTHQDGRLHIEGHVGSPSDITLEKAMRSIGITFTNEQLFEKKNGDACNGAAGKIVLLVNGQPNSALAQYSIKDGDRFEIKFE